MSEWAGYYPSHWYRLEIVIGDSVGGRSERDGDGPGGFGPNDSRRALILLHLTRSTKRHPQVGTAEVGNRGLPASSVVFSSAAAARVP
jgi:hypothetical protein